jgi:8-amino-7-oxononanoate synthase
MEAHQQTNEVPVAEVKADLFAKVDTFTLARQAQREGWYPFFTPLEDTEGTEVIYQGRRLIMIGSNNYLGLTTDPRVRAAACAALNRYGPSCTGSRFLNGNLRLHEQLEHELAAFVGKESALVFSTGFQVNLGVIGALVGRGDVAIIDRDDHASIVEGCRATFGEIKRFQHNNMADLARVLRLCSPRAGKLVIVDGVYSMGGDLAALPEIVRLCQEYGARLLVDDAHATGVIGGGRGSAAHFGLTDQVDLIGGTFSKAFASLGGFVAGDERIIHYIKHFASAFIFSASITPASTAAALAALQIMRDEPEHCTRVNVIGARMRDEYRRLGFEIGATTTPIVPLIIGDDKQTILFWKGLFEAGIFTNAVIPPACPPHAARLRTSYMATHTDGQLDQVLTTMEQVGRKAGIIG